MNICMVVGVEDAVRVVLGAIKHLAAPDKLPRREDFDNLRRYGDVEVFFDMRPGQEGKANFHFVTHDNITVSFEVDFNTLNREVVEGLVPALEDAIGQKRRQRGAQSMFHAQPSVVQ